MRQAGPLVDAPAPVPGLLDEDATRSALTVLRTCPTPSALPKRGRRAVVGPWQDDDRGARRTLLLRGAEGAIHQTPTR
jgi:hypothetical protein